jgi:DnaK suppressor protein
MVPPNDLTPQSKEYADMWMTREEIAKALGIVVNSVRGKVQRGQIERKVIDGKNFYRIVDPKVAAKAKINVEVETKDPEPEPASTPAREHSTDAKAPFDPEKVLVEQLASLRVGRSIDAIEKGDEIDLATGEISRELEANLTMRQQKQLKEIQDALERIKLGEYGICEECGETIPEQRLRLFPAARLCVRCQEEADRYNKLKREVIMRGGTWREDSADLIYGKFSDD